MSQEEPKPALLWQAGQELKIYEFDKGTYYLGRLDTEDYKKYRLRPSYRIYIIPPQGNPYDTKVESIFVSRRHLKIIIGEDKVVIGNHGHDGMGTKNPTYINSVSIGTEPNNVEYPLCKPLTIRLGVTGPAFFLTCLEQGKPVLEILPEAPIEMPKAIAEELRKQGLLESMYDKGDIAYVVISKQSKATAEVKVKDRVFMLASTTSIKARTGRSRATEGEKPGAYPADKWTDYDLHETSLRALAFLISRLEAYLAKAHRRAGSTSSQDIRQIIREFNEIKEVDRIIKMLGDQTLVYKFNEFRREAYLRPFSTEATSLAAEILSSLRKKQEQLMRMKGRRRWRNRPLY